MRLGVLNGDAVPIATAAYWDSAQLTISKFNFPIYIAAGNHDRGPEFRNRSPRDFYSFVLENDLFIVLNPNKWNIDGDQKDFLVQTIQSN
ncbi:hypothetical protein OAE04_00885 [bacterium]|nr:hypothetical protein [Vicingaceae bacterium]MDC0004906.1 hypothetical protein [bacterium]